jgi:hypothetical protein
MKKLLMGTLMVCWIVGFVGCASKTLYIEPNTTPIKGYTYPVVVTKNTNIREGKGIKSKMICMVDKGTVINLTFRKPFDPYNDNELWLNTCTKEVLYGWVNIKYKIDDNAWVHIYETTGKSVNYHKTIGKLLSYTGKKDGDFFQVQYTPFIPPHKQLPCGYIYKRNLMFFETGAEASQYAIEMKNEERIAKERIAKNEERIAKEKRQERIAKDKRQERIAKEKRQERKKRQEKIAKEKRQKRKKKQEYELLLAKKNGCILYLKKWSWYNERNYVYAKGEVQNISGKRLGSIKVLVTWFDKNGTYIDHDYSYLTLNVLMPNQSSPFKIMERHNPLMVKANIKFLINNSEIKIYRKQ